MLLIALSLFFSFIDVLATFQFPTQHSNVGNTLGQNENFLHRNDVIDCRMENILNVMALEDLQSLIEGMASRAAISPFLILRKLHRKMLNGNHVKEIVLDTLDGSPFTEAPSESVLEYPSQSQILLESSRAPYSVSSRAFAVDSPKNEEIIIVPVDESSLNRLSNKMKMGNMLKATHNEKPVLSEMSNMLPGIFLPPIKQNRLKPPLGAIVHIDSEDPLNPISRDITLTVSPLMTFIETLRILELNEMITFSHSTTDDCYVVNSIAHLVQNEQYRWKGTIKDRDNKVVYDSFCLPSNEDILVKPGSEISLRYVSF